MKILYQLVVCLAVLQSGHFAKIAEWRDAEALKITQDRRPDLLEG